MILTDEEVYEIAMSTGAQPIGSEFVRFVESAVLKRLGEQEPFAYVESGGVWYTYQDEFNSRVPVFTHPAPPKPEWKAIETAPRDRAFLAVLDCAGDRVVCTMRWPVAEAKNSRPDNADYHVERVTHWQHLPSPPEAK